MSELSLHRYSPRPEPGDLDAADLLTLWGLLRSEKLVEVFFHDGSVRNYREFLAYVQQDGGWFYAARAGGVFIGFGLANGFSSAGNTAFAHFCTFKGGRGGAFTPAARLWLRTLAGAGLDTLLAVLPHCYRAARAWAESLGFAPLTVLPQALRLVRGERERLENAWVYAKDLRPGIIPCAPARGGQPGAAAEARRPQQLTRWRGISSAGCLSRANGGD